MRFPRKVSYCLLSALVLASWFFRYPLGFGHEAGSDTTFVHSLANSLVAEGRALWILHPTSYFGLYALSYPSAMPFLLAGVSSLGGLPIEGAILLMGFAFGAVGALSAFTATRSATGDDRFALIVALLFSTAPFFIKDTTWIGSSRGYVTALVPAVFLVLLLHLRKGDVRFLLIAVLLVATMSAFHRMGILTIFVLIAYLFAVPFHRITQKLRFELFRYEGAFRFVATGSAVAGFFILFYVQFLFPGVAGPNVVEEYGSGTFLTGSTFPILLTNMVVSLAGKVGVLLPLAALGLVRFAWKRPKENRDKFFLVAAFTMIPLLSLRDYIAEFLVFVFVVFVAFAFLPKRKRVGRAQVAALGLTALLVVSSVAMSWFMKDYWRERYYTDSAMTDELYTVGLYARWQTLGNLVANEGMMAGRVTAIADRPVLPIGGASTHWWGPQQLTFGFVDGGSVAVQQIPLTQITFQTDEIFVPVGIPNAKDGYEAIFYGLYGDRQVERTLLQYEIRYVVVTDARPTEFLSYIWRSSPFLVGVAQQSYKVYDSGVNSVWRV